MVSEVHSIFFHILFSWIRQTQYPIEDSWIPSFLTYN